MEVLYYLAQNITKPPCHVSRLPVFSHLPVVGMPDMGRLWSQMANMVENIKQSTRPFFGQQHVDVRQRYATLRDPSVCWGVSVSLPLHKPKQRKQQIRALCTTVPNELHGKGTEPKFGRSKDDGNSDLLSPFLAENALWFSRSFSRCDWRIRFRGPMLWGKAPKARSP